MLCYIITCSAVYYPTGGAGDFRYIGTDLDEARTVFKGICDTMDDYSFAHLIEVNPAEGRWTEIMLSEDML